MRNGFTLIEIIAVLILVAILAVVAIPKYMNMQDEAEEKSAQAGLAEGLAACSFRYAKAILDEPPTQFVCTAATVQTSGDLVVVVTGDLGNCTVTSTIGGTVRTAVWTRPN